MTLLLGGLPLWWVLGIDSVLPLVLAVPMALQLLRRRRISLPRAFGWWLLFLLWVALGVGVLWAEAPDAMPGSSGSRLLVYLYRAGWYVTCTVVLLWVATLDRDELSDVRVRRLVGWVFVIATAGGVLGLLAPTLEFRSAFELLLPHGLRANPFVSSLVHPQAADVQDVLGRPETRPKAPFPFANTWGSCLSITVVFFLAVVPRRSRATQLAMFAVVGVALVPVVYSLDRGLWACLALGVVGALLMRLLRGDPTAFLTLGIATVLGLTLFLLSPLGTIYQERLDHQHSNDRRSQLLDVTTASVSKGSPVVGFGSTRDVEGSFASITGAATPQCPACGVPPLGTQGQLWLVVFSQGWIGLAFFLIFVALALSRSWRCRTVNETVCTFVVGFFVVQLPIYDTLGLPLFIVMIAIGLTAREQASDGPGRGRVRPVIGSSVRVVAPLVLIPALIGGALGAVLSRAASTTTYRDSVSILITPAPVYLDTGVLSGTPSAIGTAAPVVAPRAITIDTEAALVLSSASLTPASRLVGVPVASLRAALTVTAPPSSEILDLTLTTPRLRLAQTGVDAVASAYLVTREEFLTSRRDELLADLNQQLRTLTPGSPDFTSDQQSLTTQIAHLQTIDPGPGRVIRHPHVAVVHPQVEVPVDSGVGLGFLLGFLLLHRRNRARRPNP